MRAKEHVESKTTTNLDEDEFGYFRFANGEQ